MKMENFPAIDLIDISQSYRDKIALQDISLALSNRQCLALVGHNGAGKTTLIKIILGLLKPNQGAVKVLHQDPASRHFNNLRCSIGFLPEQVLFQKTLTGRETLAFYARLKGLPTNNLDDYFDRVDLRAAADRRVGTYSKGMRQRLGIAQALLGQPKLLVLDEPTTGLDPVARQNIYRIIDEEKKSGAAVLISSHVLTEMDHRIDRVAILSEGRMVAHGSIPFLRHHIGMRSSLKITADPESCGNIAAMFEAELPVERPSMEEIILRCLPEQKLEILKKVMAMDATITDIELTDPSLEHVFNAYSSTASSGGNHV
ncbi:ABC transporter ATP-binding protein [Sneathiella sp.]|uniref:ABC transporter ATP-binding protein n=1 Tax=Sneathiella sp. TaxID=1964365 RepID=UPI002611D842|nr:ABC transporter ATP-binding protein [Sneathiella sp.]MDF2368944.1 ABC transporter ATP-binding protein [Sneathiella sp.]